MYRHRGAEAIRTRERAARGQGGVDTAAWINEKRAADLLVARRASLIILLFSVYPAFWCPNFGRWRPVVAGAATDVAAPMPAKILIDNTAEWKTFKIYKYWEKIYEYFTRFPKS